MFAKKDWVGSCVKIKICIARTPGTPSEVHVGTAPLGCPGGLSPGSAPTKLPGTRFDTIDP